MSLHRQNGDVSDLRTKQLPWSLASLIAVMLIFFVIGLWSFAMDADFREADKANALARAERERLAMPAREAAAYERGLADAIEGLKGTRDELVLAQVCAAQGERP